MCGDFIRYCCVFWCAKANAYSGFPYVDALRKKKYTVMAVVGDAYRNQMVWGDENTTGFEYILPTQLMERFDRKPELFLVTMDMVKFSCLFFTKNSFRCPSDVI